MLNANLHIHIWDGNNIILSGLPVRILSVRELKDSTFTTRQGEQKLLVKREFIISNGYDEIACEMLGDRAKMWGNPVVEAALWRAHMQIRTQRSESGSVWNNVILNNLTPLV